MIFLDKKFRNLYNLSHAISRRKHCIFESRLSSFGYNLVILLYYLLKTKPCVILSLGAVSSRITKTSTGGAEKKASLKHGES
jgi:hypothetical protein